MFPSLRVGGRAEPQKPEKAEVIRIRVKKCNGLLQPEYKKLCVDPQLTTFEVLRSLLFRAFDIKGDFSISYLSKDESGQELYLSLLSDWDLDAAFLGASDPYLRLKVDLRPFEEGLDDWDIVGGGAESSQRVGARALLDSATLIGTLTGTFTQVGKTVTQVSKAIGLWNEEQKPPAVIKPPMTDAEFHRFLDGVGHMIQPQEFRLSVYRGGIDPSLRKVVWRHLLNVYPESLSGKERFGYLQQKVREYQRLRDEWRELYLKEEGSEEVKAVINMVKKDVLRTDRGHAYYAGSDENKNILSLFNLLVTYALTHPEVSYCQGMSDLASPILLVQDDEAHTYVCFCSLMRKLRSNFSPDGLSMTTKFQHLSLLLQHQDPLFFTYLKEQNAEDMFFCYRWLLLELKREFPLDDTLYMLEVMWSSQPPDPPNSDLPLADPCYYASGLITSPTSPTLASLRGYVLLRSRLRRIRAKAKEDQCPTSDGSKLDQPQQELNAVTPCEDPGAIDPQEFKHFEDSTVSQMRSEAAMIDRALAAGAEPVVTSDGEGEEEYREDATREEEMPNPVQTGSEGIQAAPAPAKCGQTQKVGAPLTGHTESVQQEGATVAGREDSAQEVGAPVSGQKLSAPIPGIPVIVQNGSADVEGVSSPEKTSTADVPTAADNTVKLQDDGRGSSGSVCQSTVSPSTKLSPIVASSISSLGADVLPLISPKRPSNIPLMGAPSATKSSLSVIRTDGSERPAELSSCEEAMESLSIDYVRVNSKLAKLPSPPDFGHGNPFLMFLCLTLLQQHRDHIMANRLDYNELAMHFDRMVRKHDAATVVVQARALYASYLKTLSAVDTGDTPSSDDVSV